MNHLLARAFLGLACLALTATAGLIKGDFLNPGDGLLITDTATNLQWLTPLYTRNHLWNDATVQNIENLYGFQYATYQQALSMIDNNFNNPPVSPGTPAGFADAQNFFNIFGIAEQITCGSSPCPRTQGLTADSDGNNGHFGIGMIQFGSNGYLIAQNPWPDNFSDLQMGSLLIRSTVAAAPEPASLILIGLGAAVLFLAQYRITNPG